MDALISVTSKKIETQLKYVFSLSAMDEAPAFVLDHLIPPKNMVQRIPVQFVNKTCDFSHQKNLLI